MSSCSYNRENDVRRYRKSTVLWLKARLIFGNRRYNAVNRDYSRAISLTLPVRIAFKLRSVSGNSLTKRWFRKIIYYTNLTLAMMMKYVCVYIPEVRRSNGTARKRGRPPAHAHSGATSRSARGWTRRHNQMAPSLLPRRALWETRITPLSSAFRNVHDRSTFPPASNIYVTYRIVTIIFCIISTLHIRLVHPWKLSNFARSIQVCPFQRNV